jgi:hypothetical protein
MTITDPFVQTGVDCVTAEGSAVSITETLAWTVLSLVELDGTEIRVPRPKYNLRILDSSLETPGVWMSMLSLEVTMRPPPLIKEGAPHTNEISKEPIPG